MAGNMVVQIRNYQRIKKANFVFEPGLNVIVGASNNGKSSTLRAITSALFNLSKDSHITIGETMSVVGIRYNGHDVVWKRDLNLASKNSYKIDGKTYTKLGKGQPKEVADALGIFEIDLDDTRERLNFQRQMAYPFLLDRTPSQVFKFMAQSAEEDNLMSIIDQMKTDQNSISATIKANEASMDSIKVALLREKKAFEEIKDKAKVCKVILDLDAVVKKFTELENMLIRADESEQARSSSLAEVSQIDKVLPVYVSVIDEAGPLWGELQELGRLVESANNEYTRVLLSKREFEETQGRLQILDSMPPAEAFTEMATIWALYSQGHDALRDKRMYEENVEVLSDQINGVTSVLKYSSQLLSEAESTQNEMSDLRELIGQAMDYESQVDSLKFTLSNLADNLVAVENELAEFDVCPYCGSELK